MHVQLGRNVGLDGAQKGEELLTAMADAARRSPDRSPDPAPQTSWSCHAACSHGYALGNTRGERQQRLGSIQRLDLENSMASAEKWAAGIGGPAYAIDDQTAIKVVDGAVEVVSEGHWRFFAR